MLLSDRTVEGSASAYVQFVSIESVVLVAVHHFELHRIDALTMYGSVQDLRLSKPFVNAP